jgi:Molecular chaperone GrpE (heat shock protein)
MEKNENLQDKSEIESESTDKENQENLHQDTSNNLNEDEGEKKEILPEDKINDLEDKLKRTFAEMENQRRRFEKEKDDAYNYGGFNFAKEALNLLDNLERSKTSLENDKTLKDSEILKKTIDHLNIIYNDMISIFKKNEIEEIKSIDQKLDPNIHQAMLEIEDKNKEPGTVIQEIQKGFMMKGRLLRPSLVAVSKKPPENDEKTENSKKDEENQSKNEEKI